MGEEHAFLTFVQLGSRFRYVVVTPPLCCHNRTLPLVANFFASGAPNWGYGAGKGRGSRRTTYEAVGRSKQRQQREQVSKRTPSVPHSRHGFSDRTNVPRLHVSQPTDCCAMHTADTEQQRRPECNMRSGLRGCYSLLARHPLEPVFPLTTPGIQAHDQGTGSAVRAVSRRSLSD